jgi:hypothetical protein
MKFVLIFLFILIFDFFDLYETNSSKSHTKMRKFSKSLMKMRSKMQKFHTSTKSTTKFKSLLKITKTAKLGLMSFQNLNKMDPGERFQGFPAVKATTTINLGPGPIYHQGWKKYFIIRKSQNQSNGNKFFKNSIAFKEESNPTFKTSHEGIYQTDLLIPDEDHFYFILTDEYLNVVTSRYNDIAKTIDIAEIKSLFDVKQGNDGEVKGGIEDLGNFQEGFCFSLRGKSSSGPYKWVICADSFQEKCDLMQKIIALRLRCQIKFGVNKSMSAITNIKFIKPDPAFNSTISTHSRWVNLQEWSSCTLACGGGSQTLHRFCLKAPNSLSCEGSSVITRPCNTQPCANVTDEVIESEMLPTEIRIIPVSLRPRRFTKCVVKEEDMDIVRYDIGKLKIPPRIPSRVIVNNKTLSIFESGSYDSILSSYYLTEISVLEPWKQDPKKCLKIADKIKSSILCVMACDTAVDNSELKIKEWIAHIREFRDDCNLQATGLKVKISIDDPRLIKIRKELEAEELRKQTLLLEKKKSKQSERESDKALKLAQLIALKTIDKERKFEERLEKEELLREEKEDEDLRNEYVCEERKKANLLRALIEKNNNKNKKDEDMKEKLSEIQNDLKQKLLANRNRILKKISLLKFAHERRKNKFRQQIMDVRRVLTQNVINAEKRGNENYCILAMFNDKISDYCSTAFSSDPSSVVDCNKKENFCYMCCENEYGDMHQDEREHCMKKCETKEEERKKVEKTCNKKELNDNIYTDESLSKDETEARLKNYSFNLNNLILAKN